MPTPQYIALADLPMQGPDEFSADAKEQAARHAEAQLEADVNDGREIADPEAIHEQAALAWATYLLFIGPEHPTSSKAGDFSAGSGEDVMEVAREMKSVYNDAVAAINQAEGDAGYSEFTLST
jgi:hypothetical protein